MNALKTIYHDILLVWTFFTRIPAPHFMTERKLSQALWALPLVCLVIGIVQILVWICSTHFIAEPFLSAVLLVVVPMILTGALHWDGLADYFDGLGVQKIRRSEVMRDSSLGTFGALTLLCFALLQVAAYQVILGPGSYVPFSHDLRWNLGDQAIIAGFLPLISRFCMALLWGVLPPMDGASQVSRLGRPFWPLQLIYTALILVLLALVLGPLVVIGFAIISLVWTWFVSRSLDGINGDGLGASQVFFDTALLMSVIAFS